MLMHKIRMLIQLRAQTSYVTCIEEFHGTAKMLHFQSAVGAANPIDRRGSVFRCAVSASPNSEIHIRGRL